MGTSVDLCWAGVDFLVVGTSVEIGTGVSGGGNYWCGTSVEFKTGVGSSVEMGCLWCVVEVGCAVEGRGRFVRGVCGN